MTSWRCLSLATALCIATSGCLAASDTGQGVSRSEIVLGSILDLSGPMEVFGHQVARGMQMRVAEINQQGGVNGRLLRLVIVDSGSGPEQARAAAGQLVQRDHVFAALGTLGGVAANAAMPILMRGGAISFLPIASGQSMYQPPDRLKVAFLSSTGDALATALPYLMSNRAYQRVCSVAEAGPYGSEVQQGTDDALRRMRKTLAERISYAHATHDFTATIAHLQAANCDLVVIGGAVSDAVSVIALARHDGINADFIGTDALYSSLMHELGGHAVDGVYAVSTVCQPYIDDASKLVRDWTEDYEGRFHEQPSVYAVYGWLIVDLFAKAAARAGPVLSVASFNAALESTTFPRDMFGSPEFHISSTDRLGMRKVRVSQIIDGHWVAVSNLLGPPIE